MERRKKSRQKIGISKSGYRRWAGHVSASLYFHPFKSIVELCKLFLFLSSQQLSSQQPFEATVFNMTNRLSVVKWRGPYLHNADRHFKPFNSDLAWELLTRLGDTSAAVIQIASF
jgi:hypothetical protein